MNSNSTNKLLRNTAKYTLLAIALLFFLFSTITANAVEKSVKLKQLIQKINTLKTNLEHTKKQQTEIQQKLKKSEVDIGKLSIATKKTAQNLEKEHRVLKQLNIKQNDYQNKFTEEKKHLMNETKAFYLLGNDGYIKMLLNAEDPTEINRLYIYYQYLLKSHTQAMNNLTYTLQKLHRNNKEIQKQTKIYQNLYTNQKSDQKKLILVQKERSASLQNINKDLKTKNANLKQLLADKQALEELLARISAQKRAPVISGSLATLRGRLLSPTSGKIESAYGGGEARLNGLIINTPEGQPVHAIAGGRVVFADWLQGYGLLLIIDHGHGYMSLYGRNQSLYKKTDENVARGEIIATVGNSGGYEKTGLYFAMRYNGKPIDPTAWIAK